MTSFFAMVLLGLLALCLPAVALEARVEQVNGVPTLLVNGKPTPPMILMHTAGAGAQPMVCRVTPEWQQFSFTFQAPRDDDNAAVHIRNVAPVGDWYVDDAVLVEGTLENPRSANLLRGGEFEGPALPEDWTYFLNPSKGAEAYFSLDTENPRSGQSCLQVHIASPGVAIYEIHIYQTLQLKAFKIYTFSVWLRASDERPIEIQAIHQGPPWTIYGGSASPSDKILRLGASRGLHIGTPPMEVPWPRGDRPPDYTGVDAQMEHILSVNPDALTIPRLHLAAPDWWLTEHPQELMVYDGGPRQVASASSELWRRDASRALRLLLRHLEQRWGDHMLGYHVTALSAGEWFYPEVWESIMPCFEEPVRAGFARWLRAKYGTDDALRAAWAKPEASLQSVRVPTLAERTAGNLGAFRDPRTQRFEIDFAQYMQDCVVEYLEECARIVKEQTGGRKLGVFFYGYLYDVAGFPYGAGVSGHMRLRRLLDSPHVDIICSPISYFDRQSGGTGPFMAPVDSIQAHGKLWINEDDTRTHLAPVDANFGRTETMAQTLGVYRRNFGHQLERRCGTWWMDFGTGWMADETIFDNFARERDIWIERGEPTQFRPEVAIITDEESFLYLRSSNEISGPAVSWARRDFNRIGCPVGLYLMDDLCEGNVPDSVRLYVFLNAFRVTAAQRQAIHDVVTHDNKVALWLYAPGYILEQAGLDNMEKLIGFRVIPARQGTVARIRVRDDVPAPLEALPGGHVFGTDARPSPLFAVAPGQEEQVISLGTYEGTDQVALAFYPFLNWSSVFCGAPSLSPELLRCLALLAGAHIYCYTNDVISGSHGFVSIHATTGGEKVLTFPSAVRLHDLIAGETLEPASHQHSFQMEMGETRLFGVEEATHYPHL